MSDFAKIALVGVIGAVVICYAAFLAATASINYIVFGIGEKLYSIGIHAGLLRNSEGRHHLTTLIVSLLFWWIAAAFVFAGISYAYRHMTKSPHR